MSHDSCQHECAPDQLDRAAGLSSRMDGFNGKESQLLIGLAL